MKTFKQYVNEDRKSAWGGGLDKIDKLLAWMYDKDILSKTDKAAKDSVFHQYYRYYNDGDMPRALANKGMSRYTDKKVVQKALEEYLTTFIKKMLSKYWNKIDRTDFRWDSMSSLYQTIKYAAKDGNGIDYWLKKVQEPRLAALRDQLAAVEADIRQKGAKLASWQGDKVLSYAIRELKPEDQTPEIMAAWKKYRMLLADVSEIASNLITGIEKLKQIKEIQ